MGFMLMVNTLSSLDHAVESARSVLSMTDNHTTNHQPICDTSALHLHHAPPTPYLGLA